MLNEDVFEICSTEIGILCSECRYHDACLINDVENVSLD